MYDRVFRDAMKEMYNLLITKSALAMGNPNNFHPLKFRDLMSSFRGTYAVHEMVLIVQYELSSNKVHESP